MSGTIASSAMTYETAHNYQGSNISSSQKMYVNPSDILVTENGLFLLGATEFIVVHGIETDEFGFYVELKENPKIGPRKEPTCINGHPVYHKECGGCAHWFCNSRCKCYSPWSVR